MSASTVAAGCALVGGIMATGYWIMSRKRRFPFIKQTRDRRDVQTNRSATPDADLSASDLNAPAAAWIGAYSIGATDPEEAAWVRAHLASNPEAAQELAHYQQLFEQLLHSAPEVEPPVEAAERLAAALEAESNATHSARPGAVALPPSPVDATVAGNVAPRINQRTEASAPRRRWTLSALPNFGWSRFQLATVALLALLVVTNLISLTKIRSLQAVQDRLWRQISSEQYTQQSLVQVILSTYETTSFEVAAAQEGSGARAYVEWCPQTYTVLVEAGDFPLLESDMTYQLWLIRDGKRTSGGLFTVDSWGSGTLVMQLDEPLDNYDALGITPEPAGGSSGPTAPPVVRKEF